jgi:hypothetical protein
LIAKQKKPPVGVSQLGELVIRVHLPINDSLVNRVLPEKSIEETKGYLLGIKKAPSRCKPARGVSYQGASTN